MLSLESAVPRWRCVDVFKPLGGFMALLDVAVALPAGLGLASLLAWVRLSLKARCSAFCLCWSSGWLAVGRGPSGLPPRLYWCRPTWLVWTSSWWWAICAMVSASVCAKLPGHLAFKLGNPAGLGAAPRCPFCPGAGKLPGPGAFLRGVPLSGLSDPLLAVAELDVSVNKFLSKNYHVRQEYIIMKSDPRGAVFAH
ncbi:hypothetical protein E2C01_095412 [Portunus trituberculatus]|uniref:Uncharacterized protein n=1 Tax=Portunus trituberculatus TaxID=210409 RepID=A0A5B7JZC4_PORTR|nr:hypothetical protein [Portunus trituberculatus]